MLLLAALHTDSVLMEPRADWLSQLCGSLLLVRFFQLVNVPGRSQYAVCTGGRDYGRGKGVGTDYPGPLREGVLEKLRI